jgi:23S rRNA pseudouridine2605 synthase
MRHNGHGALTLEEARTWIEETGLCLFLPRRQFSSSIAPSFVEAVAGHQNATPDPKHIQLAEELLVRLELDDVAVRLNLLGQPGEQPDFVVASWVLPYVYALRGDRDWRRSPQLTGSRQVSQLAVQAYKLLETNETNIADLKHTLGREVTETAVLRAITELWQQLRIIPVIAAPGVPAKWQLLKHRFQKAIAEGASTSQVTAISVLASIYLQAVIAASMEEVEMFLAPLTARSKVREVLRGLVATRQVHTISLGHAPQFYVAGTLPEFAVAPSLYSSSSMPASAYFLHSHEHEEDSPEVEAPKSVFTPPPAPVENQAQADSHTPHHAAKVHASANHSAGPRKPASNGKPVAARPHFSRPATPSRDRKPAQPTAGSRPVRRTGSDARPAARPSGSRPASGARWTGNASAAKNSRNGAVTGGRPNASTRPNASNGTKSSNGSNGSNGNGHAARPVSGSKTGHGSKQAAPTWGQRNNVAGNGHSGNGHEKSAKPAGKAASNSPRPSGLSRAGAAPRKDVRTDARPTRNINSRKPTLAAGTNATNNKRYGFTARPAKQETKKRG